MELPHITEQNELHVSNSEVALDRIQNKKICPFLWWGAFWDRVSLNTLGTLCCNSRYRPSLPKTRVSSPASWLLGFKVCAITEQLGNILFSRHRKLTASNMCIQEYSVCVCVCPASQGLMNTVWVLLQKDTWIQEHSIYFLYLHPHLLLLFHLSLFLLIDQQNL